MPKVIMSTGDKGGTGKSFTARFVAEVLLGNQHKLTLIDCDANNPDLITVFSKRHPVESIDVRNAISIDHLFRTIDAADADATFLLDMPAGAGEYLAREADILTELFNTPTIELHVLWSLNTDKVGILQLKSMTEAFADADAHYTVVKNGFFTAADGHTNPFHIWDASNIRKNLKEREILTEVTLPIIRKELMTDLGYLSLYDDMVHNSGKADRLTSLRWAKYYKHFSEAFGHIV